MSPHHILSYDSRLSDGTTPQITIGKYCSIAANCTFVLSNHLTDRITTSPSTRSLFHHGKGNPSSFVRGNITIGSDVWIGANCTILDNVMIGNGAVVAAGAVVTKSVPPYAIVGGNPAKIIKYRFDAPTIARLEKLRIWDKSNAELDALDLWTDDIDGFLRKLEA